MSPDRPKPKTPSLPRSEASRHVGPAVPPALGASRDHDAPPIGTQDPSSMPRAEDDARVFEQSPEFQDQPGSGKHLGGPSVRDMARASQAPPAGDHDDS
ncbi:MAG: hypothetical protein R2712_21190 [Vicinamibacterales bacterium]